MKLGKQPRGFVRDKRVEAPAFIALILAIVMALTIGVSAPAQASVRTLDSGQYCGASGFAYGLPWKVYKDTKATNTDTRSYDVGRFCMMSNNGKYTLKFDTGGVLNLRQGTKVIWSRGVKQKSSGSVLLLQWNGNMTIKTSAGKATWTTSTNNHVPPYHELYLTDAGKIRIYQDDSSYKHIKLLWGT